MTSKKKLRHIDKSKARANSGEEPDEGEWLDDINFPIDFDLIDDMMGLY